MRLVLAALVCSTGCAQILGIDETTGLDASSSVASVQIQQVFIGASVLRTPQDMSMQMATFYDDAAQTLAPVPGVLAAMDTFTADAPGTPSVIYTLPDVQVPTRMLAFPVTAQKANYVEFEHANRQDPLPNSQIQLNITLPSAFVTGESFTMSVIGAWMAKNLTAAQLPLPDMALTTIATTFPYTELNPSVSGNPDTRITMADAVLLLRYNNAPSSHLTGVYQAPPFEQTDGTDMIAGTMTAVPATSMATATTTPADYNTRFAAVRPGVTSALTQTWSINAAPGHSLANDTGVRLINGALADPGMGMVPPSAITAAYGNPFESLDWKAVMRVSTTKTRSYTYTDTVSGMAAAFNLAATMIALTEPGMDLSFTMPAGLPITIEANQQTLVTDGMMLPLDLSQPVVIEATLDRPTNTAYELNLTEVSLDVSGASPVIVRTNRLNAVTTGEARFRLPPELFTVGKTYYVTIRSYQGAFPNVADGDIQVVSLPYSLAQLDSAVFTVGMP